MIARGLLVPEVEKFALDAKPTPPLPLPWIELVAVMFPVVVKAAPTLMPLPPVVELFPPTQLEKVTALLPVNAVEKFTPWLLVPVPPEPERVTRPVVPGVQLFVLIETPSAPVPVSVLLPLNVIVPDVLVTELSDPARLMPILLPPPVDPTPVIEMLPLPVVVETSPVLLMFTP